MTVIPRETLINLIVLGVCLVALCVLAIVAEWQIQCDQAQLRRRLATLERQRREYSDN